MTVVLNSKFWPAVASPLGFADLDPAGPLAIGTGIAGALEGTLDEMRISRGRARPPEWVRATHYSETGRLVRHESEERRDR